MAKRRSKLAFRRFGTIAAMVAVPAMASPDEWSLRANSAEAAPVTLMGFEQSGESFPGSAFYYLEDAPQIAAASNVPTADGSAVFTPQIAAEASPLSATPNEPAARAMRIGGSGTDMARAQRCMTLAIYYEAASESDAGQRAVAQVVLNRVAHPTYPNTVCGVVFQGSERSTGCQFSFTCDGAMNRQPSTFGWNRAAGIARDALAGVVYAPVGLATHYHTIAIHPYWADSLHRVGTIGMHHFYNWKGAAGRPEAFTGYYRGGEPLPQRTGGAAVVSGAAGPVAPALLADPVALGKAYDDALAAATALRTAPIGNPATGSAVSGTYTAAPRTNRPAAANGSTAPSDGSTVMQGSGAVREQYSRSGAWLKQPGS